MTKGLVASTKKISAIVLASGFSRRFDDQINKLLVTFHNKPIYQWSLDLIRDLSFFEVLVIARDKEILDYAKANGFKPIENYQAAEGISASIRLGVTNASIETDGYMFFTADQPLLKKADILKLFEAYSAHDDCIIVPVTSGRRGSPTIFSEFYKQPLLSLEGESGGKAVMNQYPDKIIKVEIENSEALEDIDTMEDFRQLERMPFNNKK